MERPDEDAEDADITADPTQQVLGIRLICEIAVRFPQRRTGTWFLEEEATVMTVVEILERRAEASKSKTSRRR